MVDIVRLTDTLIDMPGQKGGLIPGESNALQLRRPSLMWSTVGQGYSRTHRNHFFDITRVELHFRPVFYLNIGLIYPNWGGTVMTPTVRDFTLFGTVECFC